MGNTLSKNAKIIIEASCHLKAGETLAILTDRNEFRMACSRALEEAALELGASPVIMDISAFRKASDGIAKADYAKKLSKPIKAAVKTADAVLLLWSSWSSCGYGRLLGEPDASDRVLSGKQRRLELFTQGMDTWNISMEDIVSLWRRTEDLARELATAGEIHITTPAGTDFRCPLGDGAEPVALLGYVPLYGEATLVPAAGAGEGVYVVDSGSWIGENPVRFTVREGRIVAIEGRDKEKVDWLKRRIAASSPPETNIDEIAVVTTHLAESDLHWGKGHRHGTAHIALGNNQDRLRQIHGTLHIDGDMTLPTVEINGTIVMKNGIFQDGAIEMKSGRR